MCNDLGSSVVNISNYSQHAPHCTMYRGTMHAQLYSLSNLTTPLCKTLSVPRFAHSLSLPLCVSRGGGSTARLGGRELTLLCGFNQYALLQNRDNSGLLGTPLYCSPKLGGRCPPNAQVGGAAAAAPPCPPCGAPPG